MAKKTNDNTHKGVWGHLPQESIENEMWQIMEQAYIEDPEGTPRPTIKAVQEALREFRAIPGVEVPDNVEPPCWLNGREIDCEVAVGNGILHLDTGVLEPHTPAFFNFTAIPVPYDERAPIGGPRWLRFLDEVWPDDPEARGCLQRWIGAHLDPRPWRLQKAMLLIGKKRSGKGTIIKTMEALFGKKDCAATTLQGLGETFGLSHILNKRCVMIADARLDSVRASTIERILTITSGDPMPVNRKNKPIVTARIGARLTIATNPPVPRLKDPSGTIASRFVTLSMPISFFGREDPYLAESIAAELPALLRWAVEGWRDLVIDGYKLDTPASAADVAEALMEATSDVRSFVEEKILEAEPTDFVQTSELWADFSMWANQSGVKLGTKRAFSEEFHEICSFARRGKSKGGRGFFGIRLRKTN